MNWLLTWGLSRLKEPSTWRGLIALATANGGLEGTLVVPAGKTSPWNWQVVTG